MLCGAPLGFVQDQLWAGLARSLVWGSASLGSRPDSRSVSDSYSGRLGSKLNSARLSSCLGSIPDSTWLKTPLSARLGSAHLFVYWGFRARRRQRSFCAHNCLADRAQFCSVWVGTRGFARLDSKQGCIGSKPCSAWLETRLGSAQASDRLRLDSRLGTRFGSRPDSGSGTDLCLIPADRNRFRFRSEKLELIPIPIPAEHDHVESIPIPFKITRQY